MKMKSLLSITLFLILLFTIYSVQGQNTASGTLNIGDASSNENQIVAKGKGDVVSGQLNIFDAKSIIQQIEQEVNQEIAVWQQKGKFEKTSDYERRVNPIRRQFIIDSLTQIAVNKHANKIIALKIISDEYDADNEVYKLNFPGLFPVFIKVPLRNSEAQSFENALSQIKFSNIKYTLTPNEDFALMSMDLTNPLNNKTYHYNSSRAIVFKETAVKSNFASVKIKVDNFSYGGTIERETTTIASSDELEIDQRINNKTNPYRFALIIGNEDYHSYQTGLEKEVDVEFAERDAKLFNAYCQNLLGVPEENVTMLINARFIEMKRALDKISKLAKNTNGKAEIYVFYAGHGLPDETNREPYIIPVDVSSSQLEYAIKLEEFYEALLYYPSKKVIVFMDACFSGGARNQGLLAARGVKVKPKETNISGNLVVFSASSGEQSALPYKQKGHGIFTYFLLKKLKETNGEVTLNELSEYMKESVSINSVLINEKEQNPQVNISPNIDENWKNWKLK
jgi:hypothetical protein